MLRPVVVLLIIHLARQSGTSTTSAAAAAAPVARPGCQAACGGLAVPFPFGMGPADDGCFLQGFDLTCNTTFNPPKLFLGTGNVEVLSVSLDGALRVDQWLAYDCYYENGTRDGNSPWLDLNQRPYKFSDAVNKFVAVGCDTLGYLIDLDGKFSIGCASLCSSMTYVINGTCSGIGCCETPVPKGLRAFQFKLYSYYNHSNTSSFSPCSYAFLADHSFVFNASIFLDFLGREKHPVTLEWAVGNQTCEEAEGSNSSSTSGDYACKDEHSVCQNSTNGQGYRCSCQEGYQGNAYLEGGCEDVNECLVKEMNQCVHECINIPGSYTCRCPRGMHGDGRYDGSRCTAKLTTLQMLLSIGTCILFIIAGVSWMYWIIRERNLIQLREKFFRQNGGLFLQQQISSAGGFATLFTLEELRRASNNFDDSNIIGKGGFGTVYKGILLDKTVVAIKKSKISDKGQVEQFINEVVVLSNIIHRNVVKILGCCLESEVPLLVYEFMANGTLSDHLHEGNGTTLSFEMRLRIAVESAEALAYLHSSASTPIIHRDIKSSNILLDESYTAKVSDFGTSRLVPFDRSCLNSLVRGTFGYLDPEYFHTGMFTDKSDVYSFGVVLVELLTGEKAISKTRFTQGNGSLANCFILSVNRNRLCEILDKSMELEGNMDRVSEVAELAERCLQLRRDDRPTMREVAMVLLGCLAATLKKHHPWIREKNELAQPLVEEPLLPSDEATSYTGDSARGDGDSSYAGIVPFNILR